MSFIILFLVAGAFQARSHGVTVFSLGYSSLPLIVLSLSVYCRRLHLSGGSKQHAGAERQTRKETFGDFDKKESLRGPYIYAVFLW